MFTGIIEDVGSVEAIDRRANALVLTVHSTELTDLELGDSVAVNGPCLTVVEIDESAETFTVEVTPETYRRTNLRELQPGSPVNLESALQLNDGLDGHLVTGHIDGTGVVTDLRREEKARIYSIRPPEKLLPYLAEKGSVAVDGVSLTVVDVDRTFSVSITDYTEDETILTETGVGDEVNLEVDVIARYVERLAGEADGETDLMSKLEALNQ
ncbi:riboflavin synthase, alpha subunit [Halorhabdus utahensis DSM 12940]|uniref:Riboflavin synthase n=1 Tax=Halorhabdus utahensis (strain DSM 12940 / JCM 11049 / AX-2) TaxID=519442 RepID=C7NTK8_HALUD|nr:riboflavin synthase [Halorhabdus utahensis]ACV12198.1 riboflavin synthase, alpha subunit [Halorhabdus utahensis DSM 12940]